MPRVVGKGAPGLSDERPAGHWMKTFLRSVSKKQICRWQPLLRDRDHVTGLPRQTVPVLRYQNPQPAPRASAGA